MSKANHIPDEVLRQHIAVLGKTGSGKTSTAKLAVEQIVAEGGRVCVLDPIKSDWWGLIASADTKQPGLPFYILGGPRGHVPLHAAAGKAIGEVVATGALPLSIIDMAEFGAGEHARFFIDFAPSLFRHVRGVVHLVIEEAHIFAPKQVAGIGQETMSIHWMSRIASGARSKGIRLIVCTQRTQKLHNDVLGSCETAIIHRLTLPADQKPAVDWLKANTDAETTAKVSASLSSLKNGEGWICSGELKITERAQFPRIKTYDNTATPTGDTDDRSVRTAQVDEVKLRGIIGEAVAQAEANDPKRLKAEIANLKKQLTAKPGAAPPERAQPDPEALQRAVDRAVAARDKEWERKVADQQRATAAIVGRLTKVVELGRKVVELAQVNGEAEALKVEAPGRAIIPRNMQPNYSKPDRPVRPAVSDADTSDIPLGERRMLIAMAQHPGGVDREQLSVLCGYKRSTRDRTIQYLKQKGLAQQDGELLLPTNEGVAALGDFKPLPTGHALREYWLTHLPEGERRILEVVASAYPEPVTRESIDDATGYKRSTRDRTIQYLQARKLVKAVGRGEVRASETLFD